VLAVEAVAVAVMVARSAPLQLAVVTSAGSARFTVTAVNLGVAVVVPLVLGALVLLTGAIADRRVRWFESALSASITVFLLAELNGIRELGALIAMYALTSAAVLFGALHDAPSGPDRRLPGVFGAMVGIVPWGLIAWYEIAPVVAGDAGPAVWVRVLTIVLLALFIAASVIAWRGAGAARPSVVLSVATRSVLAVAVAWAVVAGVAAG
jgi:hypothetical protein